MPSSFLGLGTSYSGLTANQRALQVTSHNIANANTVGYTRQRMDMHAYKPDILPGGLGTLGLGVDVEYVKQIRDEFLDFKYRQENSTLGEWAAREAVLKDIESIMNEPSDSSISAVMDEFYEALHELNKTPETNTARTLVRQRAISLTKEISRMSTSFKELQKNLNFEFKTAVVDLNNDAEQISELNKIIYESELEGGRANDIRDQRNVLLDKMSELVDIKYYEDEQDRFHVMLNGTEIVSHYRYDQLEIADRDTKLNDDDAVDLVDIKWASGKDFDANSGKIKGLMDARDNIEGDYKGIPYYVDKLNEFADTLTSQINMIHKEGYGINGSTGINMFTINNMTTADYEDYLLSDGLDGGAPVQVTASVLDIPVGLTDEERNVAITRNISKILENNEEYSNKSIKLIKNDYYIVDKIKASELTISADLEDTNKIAASTTEEGLPGNGENALKITKVRHNQEMFAWGNPDDFVKSLVSNLGVDAQEAYRISENQGVMLDAIINKRESVSGVSLDEEMTNMIKYQKAYQASARMINVFDQMLDLIVNRLGQ
ncbi:MAG: flagellar hook-associated protein FlgK [Bacillota bacterium]|nr:flagellar hook-associated protein FlgK [Bacillota bacterium]